MLNVVRTSRYIIIFIIIIIRACKRRNYLKLYE
jgi:hypothetical protein